MARDVHEAVRKACLWLPEAEEFMSHGSPNFRVRGKTFATYAVNHHGDGRVALWLNAPPGSQELHVRASPEHYFVPAYVGPRGWLGVILNSSIEWVRVVSLIREAYEKTAPKDLLRTLGKTPSIKPAAKTLSPQQIDPFKSARAEAVLKRLREICLRFPETSEGRQFGCPVWAVGKKSFVLARHDNGAMLLCFWVGVEAQSMLTADPRFSIPPYIGHNGWIGLNVARHCDWQEVAALCEQSYRHFALKRMLASMASSKAPSTPD
jgi:predicted DNA-binding protein (MmcQ/YjbR family)